MGGPMFAKDRNFGERHPSGGAALIPSARPVSSSSILAHQFSSIACRYGKAGACESVENCEIDANNFTVQINHWTARTTRCGLGVVHQPITTHIANVSLCTEWPNQPAFCQFAQEGIGVSGIAHELRRSFLIHTRQDSSQSGGITDQNDGITAVHIFRIAG